jgi:hypothetical protein
MKRKKNVIPKTFPEFLILQLQRGFHVSESLAFINRNAKFGINKKLSQGKMTTQVDMIYV